MLSHSKVLLLALSFFIIFISCSDDKNSPNDPGNNAPEIQNITANPSSLKINETTTLTCDATDEDGDNLTYSWTADKGSFPNGKTALSVKWKAPGTAGSYPITATVDDGTEKDNDIVNISVVENNTGGGGVPCPGIPTVIYDGQTYNTVQIGNQCWLKENLNVGTMIISNFSSDNQTDNGIIEKYCYGNDEANCNVNGALYQWDEAVKYATLEGSQGICPDGWHIPTMEEFGTLRDEVNSSGNALKSIGVGTGSGAGTNVSGFSTLLAGLRSGGSGGFDYLTTRTSIWSSTESITGHAGSLSLNSSEDYVSSANGNTNKTQGISVRCLKN